MSHLGTGIVLWTPRSWLR